MGKYGKDVISTRRGSQENRRKLSEIMQSIKRISSETLNTSFLSTDFHWKVKDGSLIDFWNDRWHLTGILAEQFSNLFILAKQQECTLQEMKQSWLLAQKNDVVLWVRHLNEQEKTEESSFNILMQTVCLVNGEDILTWGPLTDKFDSSVCYGTIINDHRVEGPWNLIWKLKIPARSKLFLWQLAYGCLPTMSFLLKRNIVHNAKCKWCGEEDEDLVHLFWNCSLTKVAWNIINTWLDLKLNDSNFSNLEHAFKEVA